MRTRKEILGKIIDLMEIDSRAMFRRNRHRAEVAILMWVLEEEKKE